MNSEGDNDFDAFVKRQQPAPAEREQVDWAKERDEWLSRLNDLYQQIGEYLSAYIKTDKITLSFEDIHLNEENIGPYLARQMIVRIGRQTIYLTPAGTLLIGSKGRVDVIGAAGRTRLLLVDSKASRPVFKVTVSIANQPKPAVPEPSPREIKWVWKIATSPPDIRFIELTRESLFQALMEVANG